MSKEPNRQIYTDSSKRSKEDIMKARRQRQLREERRRKRRRKKRLFRAAVISGLILSLILIFVIIRSIFGFIASLTKDSTLSKDNSTEVIAPVASQTYTATILSAGDVILHSPFYNSGTYQTEDGRYDFNPVFTYMTDIYESSDFTIVNLESTISEDNYSGYPLFRAPDTIVSALSEHGADMFLLANNHIYDNGDKGLTMTVDGIEKYSLPYIGIRKQEDEITYSIQEVNGIKIGIFNYTYETGSVKQKAINGITVSDTSAPLINSFNYDNLDDFYRTLASDLEEMKSAGVEYTIAYLHWGIEYHTEEATYQQEIAQKLCDLGIDALIGGHPHVIQPVDIFTNSSNDHKMICCYSLGNHLSNQRKELMDSLPTGHTEDGLMVELTLEQTDDSPVSLTAVKFIPTWVYKNIVNGNAEYYIFPTETSEQNNEIITTLNISEQLSASQQRTDEIISDGAQRIQDALPLTAGNTPSDTSSNKDTVSE